jgi:integrase
MATIRKRGNRWHVQVRRKGCSTITRSFFQHSEAMEWSRHVEVQADRCSLPSDPRLLERMTVSDLLVRYRDSIVTRKRGCETETIVINAFLRHSLANTLLADATPSKFSAYRDERLQQVKASTLNREFCILQHAFDVARREWDIPLSSNPVAKVKKPKNGHARNRRLQTGEIERIKESLRQCRNRHVRALVMLAIETGMRRGEILAMRWQDIDWAKGLLSVPVTKTGYPRVIPLTSKAQEILKGLPRSNQDKIFPVTANALRLAWERLKRRAGIEDLHFHDLRHEAISRFFEMGLSVPEVALISGHRDYRMLFRYTHLRPEDVARKITSNPRG